MRLFLYPMSCGHESFTARVDIEDRVVLCQCLTCRHFWRECHLDRAAERFYKEHKMRVKTLEEK